jgi:hypothetical protein
LRLKEKEAAHSGGNADNGANVCYAEMGRAMKGVQTCWQQSQAAVLVHFAAVRKHDVIFVSSKKHRQQACDTRTWHTCTSMSE